MALCVTVLWCTVILFICCACKQCNIGLSMRIPICLLSILSQHLSFSRTTLNCQLIVYMSATRTTLHADASDIWCNKGAALNKPGLLQNNSQSSCSPDLSSSSVQYCRYVLSKFNRASYILQWTMEYRFWQTGRFLNVMG